MSPSHDSFLGALTALSKDQIGQAGHRYTPGIDPHAPNLRIESLFTAIENVACGAAARARFQSVLDALSKAWDRAKHSSQRPDVLKQRADDAHAFLSPMMNRLRAREASAGEEWSDLLSSLESDLLADSEHWRTEEAKLQPVDKGTGYSSARNTIRANINDIGRCLAVVREEKEYIQSSAFKVLFDPNLLVTGEWGTGKTHLLCDVTQDRIGRSRATVLVLAKNFQGSVVAEICSRIENGRTAVEVFDRLEELAYETGERAVVIVDGVNEGRRPEWQEAITTLQALVADRPNIGMIVTCRTPFEPIAIKQKDLETFHKVVHLGFDDQEFDAQTVFFQYYNLPLPEVPLLDREFSRPLTLKLICQSLQNLTSKKLAQGFAGVASGQKGMTYVLESFVNHVGNPIERQYGLRAQGCWEFLKGSDQIADGRLAGFAPCMAANMRDYIRPSEADRIIASNYPALRPAQRPAPPRRATDQRPHRRGRRLVLDEIRVQVADCLSASLSTIQRPFDRTAFAEDASRCFFSCNDQAKLCGQIPARANLPGVKSIPTRIPGAGLGAGADYRVSGLGAASPEATSTQAVRAILRIAQEGPEPECILRPVHRRDVLARPCSVY